MPRTMKKTYRRKNAYPLKLESRYFNSAITHSSTTASTTAVNDVAGGTGSSDRTGRKIACKAVEVKLSATDNTGVIRVVLYSPKQSGQVLALTNLNDPIENDEFWVLMDVYVDTINDNTTLNRLVRQALTTEFSDTAGTIRRGELYLLCRSASTTTITGHTKLWFIDI